MCRLGVGLGLGLGLVTACGADGPRDGAFGTTVSTTTSPSSSDTTGGSGEGSSTSSSITTTVGATVGDSGSSGDSSPEATTETPTTDTGNDTGEPFSFSDPLVNGTTGTALGGSFGADGWTVTANADRIYWALPTLAEGSVEFTVSGITLDNLPLNDHEIFGLYEGGLGIEHPINYNPEYRVNHYKSMIRIYGQAEVDRVGQQKIMWGMCPDGAPGYADGCTCPTSFFEEPFGGDGTWDGSPQRLRVEWGGGFTRYLRNGGVVLEIDWSASGTSFGPEALYVSIGTPRPEDVFEASMPIGAVFSDLVVEGTIGTHVTCG